MDRIERNRTAVQSPPITIAFELRSHCAPAAVPRRCRRPYCTATATSRRPYCVLIRTPSGGVWFEHARSSCSRPAFSVISSRSLVMPRCVVTASPRRCLRFHGAHDGVLDAVGTPSWCDSSLSLKCRTQEQCQVDDIVATEPHTVPK